MPTPIINIPDYVREQKNTIDYSFLLSIPTKKKVVASNKDADLLFELWTKGERGDDPDSIKVSDTMSKRDIARLKSMGFVSTSDDELVKFTKKGKIVITTMALGEESTFEKSAEPKKYTEILASMDKKNKTGYRVPKFATNNNNNLRLS